MPDLSFAAFNPRSFEQMAQALALRVLGPGTMVFGDGPDGGREASYDGRVPYPNVEAGWDGHIVMQAKFRQREPMLDDAEWLAGQLRAEFAAYSDPATGRRLPDYYILVTNVRLSSVEGAKRRGGQQKLREMFEEHGRPLGIREMHVWHAEKIAALLDGAPEILRSYDAWLGPREVLSAAFRFFQSQRPDFGTVMTRYLQRELRSQRETRLQQAGHGGEGGTNLEEVFVDLPCGGDALGAGERLAVATSEDMVAPTPLALSTLLDRFAVRLSPSASGGAPGLTPARHLLLGGPGQGKSTVSQFAGQIMRWRLLRDDPLVSSDVKAILASMDAEAARLGITSEGVRRYPVRIDLPTFADALDRAAQGGGRLSLLAHIAAQVAAVADATVERGDLRAWLGAFPWLLLLDGLDEVPASGNRAAVLRAVNEFWDEATPLDADLAMVVTTRPQGYSDDLDPDHHLRLELVRLDAGRALDYAERLAGLKLSDPERRARILTRLGEAAGNPATSSLMVSPLQVAILFQLVDQRGLVPTDRWTLFDGYLDVVVKREQGKHGPGGEVVRRRARSILKLLRQVGLLLHVDAERDGAASSFVAPVQLRRLVCDILIDEGFGDGEVDAIAAEVAAATTDRLVFLEQREEGRISFEVRSLQEYAAAAQLMSGPQKTVQPRLRAIAGLAHWQHVYRIAASKAFADPDAEFFRDTIITINRELDDGDDESRAVRRGAATSLDLLEDGLAVDQPRYRRLLVRHALDLMKLRPEHVGNRLPDLLAGFGENRLREELGARVASGERQERLAAWRTLVGLMTAGEGWADEFACRVWPEDGSRAAEALFCGAAPEVGTRLFARFRATVAEASPGDLDAEFQRRDRASLGRGVQAILEVIPGLSALSTRSEDRSLEIGVLAPKTPWLKFLLVPWSDGDAMQWLLDESTGRWRVADLIRDVLSGTTPDRLAGFVECLRSEDLRRDLRAVAAPWPLDTLAALAGEGADLDGLADDARRGGFGGPEDWSAAEERLARAGLVSRDLEVWRTGAFYDAAVATIGAPRFRAVSKSPPPPKDLAWLTALATEAAAMPPGAPLEALKFAIERAVADYGSDPMPPEVLLRLYLPPSGDRLFAPELISMIRPEDLGLPEVIAALDRVGRGGRCRLGSERSIGSVGDELVRLAVARDEPGLLSVVVAALAARPRDLADRAGVLRKRSLLLQGDPSRSVRDSARLVLALTGDLDPGSLAPTLFGGAEDTLERHAALKLAQGGLLPEPVAGAVLVASVSAFDRSAPGIRADALRALGKRMNSRRSGIGERDRWLALDLPAELHDRLVEHGSSAA